MSFPPPLIPSDEGSRVHHLDSCDDGAGSFVGREVPQGQFEQHGPKADGNIPPSPVSLPPTVEDLEPAQGVAVGEPHPGTPYEEKPVAVVEPEPITPEAYELYTLVRADLGRRFGLEPDSVRLSYIENVTWGDTSLGNPEPGMAYAQVLVPGFRMLLEAEGRSYAYHTSMDLVVLVESVEYTELAVDTPGQRGVETPVVTGERAPGADEGSATSVPAIAAPRYALDEARSGECSTRGESHDEPVTGDVSPVHETEAVSLLTDNIRAAGASVEHTGEVTLQPFISVKGQVIAVDGEAVQVFEYPDAASADAEAAHIALDGFQIINPPTITMVTWISMPHFYKTGNLMALYVGGNTAVTDAPEAEMGEQFAGG